MEGEPEKHSHWSRVEGDMESMAIGTQSEGKQSGGVLFWHSPLSRVLSSPVRLEDLRK